MKFGRIEPYIITTLVGGPCDGQKIHKDMFDGRKEIHTIKQTPATLLTHENAEPKDEVHTIHRYILREARYPRGGEFVVFAHPEMTDADIFLACQDLQKLPMPFRE